MIENTILPDGLTMRSATLADFATIYKLVQAYEAVHYGMVDVTFEGFTTDWTAPDVNLAEDSRLVFDRDERLVGYIRMIHEQYAKYHFACRIHPDYTNPLLGEYLLELAEAWARERMVQAQPGVRVTLSGWLPGTDVAGCQRYERAGLQDIRHFWRMEIELNAAPPVPAWPKGIELRPYVPGRDERTAFEVIDTAFQDHWGHTPHSFEEWKHWTIERENFDPSLWFVVYKDEQVVGGSFCILEGEYGWVDNLAVLRPMRGQGLGMALLLHSFGEFYRRGKRKAGLGVDSQNLTGALRLYQRAGMHRVLENVSYEKELRAGVELSTRTLAD